MKAGRLVMTAVAVLAAGGCGVFGDKDDELPPAELLDFKQTLNLKKAWSAKAGKGSEMLRLGLMPAGDGTRVYAAGHDGTVSAFSPQDGKRIWTIDLDIKLTAGPGFGSDMIVVAGGDGHVVALNTDDGSERWRTRVLGETLARPLVTNEGVVVYTIDGRLRILASGDGSERWGMQQDAPRLTLRGSAEPVIVGNSLVVGFDNGRLISVDMATGDTEWESMISPPSGRSDLERLSDVDGRLQAIGQDLYASGYNGRVMSLAAESGQLLWAREFSTYTGVSVDWNNLYFVTDNGELVALSRQNGSDVWRSDALLRREPTTPVPFDLTVVAGDFEGYVHFFSNLDGHPVARVRVGRGPLSGMPVVIGEQLYVQSETGELVAYRVQKPKQEDRPATDSSESR